MPRSLRLFRKGRVLASRGWFQVHAQDVGVIYLDGSRLSVFVVAIAANSHCFTGLNVKPGDQTGRTLVFSREIRNSHFLHSQIGSGFVCGDFILDGRPPQ